MPEPRSRNLASALASFAPGETIFSRRLCGHRREPGSGSARPDSGVLVASVVRERCAHAVAKVAREAGGTKTPRQPAVSGFSPRADGFCPFMAFPTSTGSGG
jgi:hypothetical protein